MRTRKEIMIERLRKFELIEKLNNLGEGTTEIISNRKSELDRELILEVLIDIRNLIGNKLEEMKK